MTRPLSVATADNYLDADVAYLLGILVARGELSADANVYRMVIHFPRGSLIAEGETLQFDIDKEIRLGLEKIRERLAELLGPADIRTVEGNSNWDLVVRWTRNTVAWRNINALSGNKTGYQEFAVPAVLLEPDTPADFVREFLRGFADVGANIRRSNRDQAGRHRVRLDILNYKGNWMTPVQLCLLLQNKLSVPVPVLTWGHPNLGREWREHQLNVYAEEFLAVGFYFDYKQQALEDLAEVNRSRFHVAVRGCPGARQPGIQKSLHPDERNADRLDPRLVGQHFNAYWQVCRALGCPRRPVPGQQLELDIEVEA